MNAFLIAALLALTCFAGAAVLASDDSEAVSIGLNGDADWVQTGKTIEFEVDASGYASSDNVAFTAAVYDSSGKLMSGAVTTSEYSVSYSDYSRTLTVTAPKTAGDYRLVVTFTQEDDSGAKTEIGQRALPFKAVDPVKLSVNLSNNQDAARTMVVYFVINGVRADDSRQEVTVPANGSKTVTYDYLVRDLQQETTFYLVADSDSLGGDVQGLGPEHSHTFYVNDNDYTLYEVLAVIVLIIVAILAIYVYRKPVKNYGKPKSRR